MRNPANGQLTAHEAGDAIPTGWELIRKVPKKKAKQAPSAAKAKGESTPDQNVSKAQVDKAVEHQWKNKYVSNKAQAELLSPGRESSMVEKDQSSPHAAGQDGFIKDYQGVDQYAPSQT